MRGANPIWVAMAGFSVGFILMAVIVLATIPDC